MATPENTLWDKAALALTADVQNRYTLTSQGKTIELGDTGVRDLSGLLQNVSGGKVSMQRVGNLVCFVLDNVIPTVAGTVTILSVASVPAMTSAAPQGRTVWGAAHPDSRIGVSAAGNLVISPATIGQAVSGTLTFATSAAFFNASRPLPGVVWGEPTGV